MRVKNFSEVIAEVEIHLSEYLQGYDIDTNKQFSCINPAHNDENPSCGIIKGNANVFSCLGCGESGNIFKAAYFLEGKAIVGAEFVTENLKYLADKYKIPIEVTPLTEDEQYELDTYRAYRLAADYILAGKWTSLFTEAIKSREWTEEICKQYGVGCVSSFREFRNTLKSYGLSASFLDDIDLGRKDIFDDGHIVFTIRDEHGRPVGFAARNLSWTEDKKNGTKYTNLSTTGAKCNIYKKGSRLFGIDRVIKANPKKSTPIYVLEGYSDVVTAGQKWLGDCVAIGGKSFSIDQLQLLKDCGFYNIILALDGDKPGQEETEKLLDTTLGGHRDLRISIINIPYGMDPDSFIREHGIKKFKTLKKWSAFEWRLSRFDGEEEPTVICNSMIPLIINESSSINQEAMIKVLSSHTGISKKSIFSDVQKVINSKEAEKERERQNILSKLQRNIARDPVEAEYYLMETDSDLFELSTRYNEDTFSEDEFVSYIDSQKQLEEEQDGKYHGFVLGADFEQLQKALCGSWKTKKWMAFGGSPNSGKTSFVTKLALNIAMIEENNACVIYHSIDDSKEDIVTKMVCQLEGSKTLEINEVSNPKFWIQNGATADIFKKREVGYEKLRELAKDGRLIVKDASDGQSLGYAKRIIRYFKNKYPDRNVVYVLDNFHKLQDFGEEKDERKRFKKLSSIFKDLPVKEDVLVISTVEYTKLQKGERPTNNSVAETVQIQYDANLLAHLYNELHELREKATHFHASVRYGDLEKMPRIEIIFGKNKISSFKGSQWFDFYPASADFKNIDEKLAFSEAAKNKKADKQETSEKKADYENFVTLVKDKGWHPGKAAHLYKDKHGIMPPWDWRDSAA